MLTIICIMILTYWIMGRDIDTLLEKVKNYDLRGRMGELYAKIRPYALKAGRAAARPLLQFCCVMSDENTSTLDRALVYAAIIYTVSPVSLLPSAVYRLLGVLDEGAAVLYVYKKVRDKISPEIEARVEVILDEWFGVEYEMIER